MRSPNLQRALLQKHCFCKTNSKNDFAPQPRRDARSEPIILKSIGKITDALTRQASKSKRFLGKQSSRQAALAGRESNQAGRQRWRVRSSSDANGRPPPLWVFRFA